MQKKVEISYFTSPRGAPRGPARCTSYFGGNFGQPYAIGYKWFNWYIYSWYYESMTFELGLIQIVIQNNWQIWLHKTKTLFLKNWKSNMTDITTNIGTSPRPSTYVLLKSCATISWSMYYLLAQNPVLMYIWYFG